VGTGTARYAPSARASERDGAVDWLNEGRLVLTLISVQQQHAQAMVEDRLGGRYLHLDGEWPREAGLGIDVATPAAISTLTRMARDTIRKADKARLVDGFLRA
jgi:uncharacterized protein